MNNILRVRAALDEMSHGRNESFTNLMSSDISWELMDEEPEIRLEVGRATIPSRFGPLPVHGLPDFIYTVDRVEGSDDCVVAQLTGRYRLTGDRDYMYLYCWVCRFDDGHMVNVREYIALQYLDEGPR